MSRVELSRPVIFNKPWFGPFSVRPGTPEDAIELLRLEDQAEAARKTPGLPPARPFKAPDVVRCQKLLGRPVVWSRLAFRQGEYAGHILGYPSSDSHSVDPASPVQHIASLMVRPSHWEKGIGGSLLDWAIAALPDLGAQAINLWADEDNTQARPLYESRGFRLASENRERLHPVTGDLQVQYVLPLPVR